MVVVTISTLVMPVLCVVMHHPGRRSVSLLLGGLVGFVVKLLLQLLRRRHRLVFILYFDHEIFGHEHFGMPYV